MSAADILLVHGAFHGAWCWEPVVRALSERGVAARVLELPGHGASSAPLGRFADDVRCLERELASGAPPALVCGHSFGGAVVTGGVARDSGVGRLVYLAGAAPDLGQSMSESMPEMLAAPIAAALREGADSTVEIDPAQRTALFFHDCAPEIASDASARLGPEYREVFETAVERVAWREHRSTYIVCADDRALPPAAQERLASGFDHRMRLPSGHSPMLSMPDRLADLLASLAADAG